MPTAMAETRRRFFTIPPGAFPCMSFRALLSVFTPKAAACVSPSATASRLKRHHGKSERHKWLGAVDQGKASGIGGRGIKRGGAIGPDSALAVLDLGQPVQSERPENQESRNGGTPEQRSSIMLVQLGLAHIAQGPVEPCRL